MPRPDAYAIALKAAGHILDAATGFSLDIRNTAITVSTSRLPQPDWPRPISGLTPERDGPWPAPVAVDCQWAGGSVELQLRAEFWTGGRDNGQIGVKVCTVHPARELLWISLPSAIGDHVDGDEVSCYGSVAFNRRQLSAAAFRSQSQGLRALAREVELPMPTPANAEAFRIRLPQGLVLPSPEIAARQLITIALIKMPFFLQADPGAVKGSLYVSASDLDDDGLGEPAVGDPEAGRGMEDERLLGIHTLPGGMLQYVSTLKTILAWAAEEPRSVADFSEMTEERYEQRNATYIRTSRVTIENLGFLRRTGDLLEVTDAGHAWLADPDLDVLFEAMHRTYRGLLEILVIGERLGAHPQARTLELLNTLLGTNWKALNQSNFRRYWLKALEMSDEGKPTERGRAALERHKAEADEIRERLDAILRDVDSEKDADSVASPDLDDDTIDSAPQPTEIEPSPQGPPLLWFDASLELTPETIREHLGSLSLPPLLPERLAAALSSGKHLLLVGPPGTGKTELALAVAAAARTLDYCAGALCATASADWTTFDTIGGYGLQTDGAMAFRPGVFLRAIERHQWLLIDELNRADVDRAFGELMTVLSGKASDTHYLLPDGRPVSLGVDVGRSHRVPKTFRVLATMNTWDKTSLFRLSYAVQRRFAIVHVGVPEPAAYDALLRREGQRELGNLPPLDEASLLRLTRLFGPEGLQAFRAIGPAVALDVVRYLRRRQAGGDALAEALELNLLSQLEGLQAGPARDVYRLIDDMLDGWASEAGRADLAGRFVDLFPHAKLDR